MTDSVRKDGAVVCVCGLAGLVQNAAALRPSGLVSLVAACEQPPTPEGISPGQHFRLEIDDITAPIPGKVLPERHHVTALVDFLGGCDAEAPLLIHCAARISRSTAAALTALCLHSDGEDEAALALRLRRGAPYASPNRRIVALADEVMRRGGRLVAAVEAMGSAEPALEGRLVRLPLARPLRGTG